MKYSLVTGGAGFIGSHIVERLLADGKSVRVLDNFSTGFEKNLAPFEGRVEVIRGDICDFETCQRAMSDVEAVYHLAARASVPRSVKFPRECNDANVAGTLNLLVASRDAGVRRFVNSASSSAYGDTPTMPKVESMTPTPLSPYAVSKLAAEHYCSCFARVYGMETISLRYFNVFGPRQDPDSPYAAVIPAFVSRLLKGERPVVFGDGEQSRDFCFVQNVVSANRLAVEAPRIAGEVVNIACGQSSTLNQILKLLNGLLGTSIAADYQPPRAGDVKHSLAALDEAKRVIGYAPAVYFDEGLKRSITWYRENL